jgi:hypothetical protein
MISSQKSLGSLLEEMQSKGLASTGSSWLERAIRQKNPALTIGVAASQLLVYDRLDRHLLKISGAN